ncbi:hypothetical protein GCM10011331_21530 [Flavimobilis marinus]|uniref:RAMA domain-containing protein n=1 Tax=Flavimobilis marinus TaxID=285351 RepID=A0A1I2GWR0_9MICO|nr:hypothetical protein [Flavimobilis marinus]GHG55116.1 hypothetical protein GCM10011331_21530 [Flavimobilis marinus]SFF21519.1 hypothetical protein SAMN04488035_2018 [Flavimobilis marinus]
MAIYQLDEDRPVLVPMQSAPAVLGADAGAVVTDHLGSLLGERVLPIAHGGDDADAPYLTCLDVAGTLLAVEIVPVLDAAGLVEAMRRAGLAGRLSRADLAERYADGPEQFAAAVAKFQRETPLGAPAPAASGGVRLVLVCSSVDAAASDALEFLRQPGQRVDVLKVGVLHLADGRRFIDISPLGAGGRGPRALEATQEVPIVGRTSVVTPPLASAQTPAVARGAAVSAPVRVVATTTPAVAPEPAVQVPEPVRAAPRDVAPEAWTARVVSPVARTRTAAARSVTRVSVTQGLQPPAHQGAAAGPRPRLRPAAVPSATGSSVHPAGYTSARTSARETQIATSPNQLNEVRTAHGALGVARTSEIPDAPDAQLVALAAQLDEPAPLVWVRARRGDRFEATLHPDGTIALPDGARFQSPHAAAAAASGSVGSDGWRVWRLGGPTGPALAEVL